jgi:hypothetical protein
LCGRLLVFARMILKVQSRSGKELATVEANSDKISVEQLKRAVFKKAPKYPVERQRLSIKDGQVLDDDTQPLSKYSIVDGSIIILKDLGPQVNLS